MYLSCLEEASVVSRIAAVRHQLLAINEPAPSGRAWQVASVFV